MRSSRALDAWRAGGFGMVGLLVLQLLLGIGANIRLTLPAGDGAAHAGADRAYGDAGWALNWALSEASPLLRAHVVAGMLLAAGSLALLALGLRAGRAALIAASLCGVVAILAAGLCGALYVAARQSLYAGIMTGGLVAGIVAYATGLYMIAPTRDEK